MYGLKLVMLLLLGHFNIVLPLKVDPKLRAGAKKAREAKRGVRSDCTLAINNFANPGCRNMQLLRETVFIYSD
jgi:hypothetical protein